MGRQSNKTFVTAGGSGLAFVSAAVASASAAQTWQGFVAAGFMFAAGALLVGVGIYARDDDVSDEGGIAPKDLPFPHHQPAPPVPSTVAGEPVPVVSLPVTIIPEEPQP